jgi:PadR family transcriptional regulator PadR
VSIRGHDTGPRTLTIYLDRLSTVSAVARRPGYATLAIMKAISNGYRHGFDIIDVTGLAGGTVYPALGRLEDEGLVASHWEDPRIAQEEGRPPRRYYELRPAGVRRLADSLREFRELERSPAGRRVRPKPRRT